MSAIKNVPVHYDLTSYHLVTLSLLVSTFECCYCMSFSVENIYLSRFLCDDKYISPDRRKSSNVLIQAFPSDFPPLPEIPLIEIEYPPAYRKKISFSTERH